VKQYSNHRGAGSYFSIALLDDADATRRSTIRGTFFNEAVDLFRDSITVGCVYRISNARLKAANPRYNTCSSPLEVIFDTNSEIVLDVSGSPSQVRTPSGAQSARSPRNSSSSKGGPKASNYRDLTKTPPHQTVGTVVNRGSWKHGSSDDDATNAAAGGSTTKEVVVTPVFGTTRSEAERAKHRADLAAAAEKRLQKQNPNSKNKRKRSKSPPPRGSSSNSPMRWTLGK